MDFIQSDIIVEASALIDELREDIAAEKIAATISGKHKANDIADIFHHLIL